MIVIDADLRKLIALDPKNMTPAIKRALRKAGATALRDMRAEASKRVRNRKRLKAKFVRSALTLRRKVSGGVDSWEWAVDVSGKFVPLAAYPHRQTKRGVSVAINRDGKRTMVKGGFIATMKSGHRGIFVRRGKRRLPIRELFGSRPKDALLHKGEAEGVLQRGGAAFAATFGRLLPLEMGKEK